MDDDWRAGGGGGGGGGKDGVLTAFGLEFDILVRLLDVCRPEEAEVSGVAFLRECVLDAFHVRREDALDAHLKGRKERWCLSNDGSGNTRQRRCLRC